MTKPQISDFRDAQGNTPEVVQNTFKYACGTSSGIGALPDVNESNREDWLLGYLKAIERTPNQTGFEQGLALAALRYAGNAPNPTLVTRMLTELSEVSLPTRRLEKLIDAFGDAIDDTDCSLLIQNHLKARAAGGLSSTAVFGQAASGLSSDAEKPQSSVSTARSPFIPKH
jgi:hypothetical protein